MPPITLAQLNVLVGADLSGLRKGLRNATKDLQATGERMRTLGANMTAAFTLPLAGIGIAATKAAVDFESSFAGIRKTMDLSEAGFQRLAAANRQLAQEIPVAVDELNRIGELAGQLGIQGVDNVLKFEETIAKLSVTTDLTADAASLAFAQIANVLQLPQDQIDRLGAAVVGLGNNFATVESSIVEFASRVAGAGKLAGLSAGSVAGIATAFSSLGINAEAGGTAVQKVLLAMQQAVVQGGAQLEQFASTAGLSAQEFAQAFDEDAGQAFVQFVEGLGTQGDQAIATLEELGLTDQRLTRAFLAAAGAGDLLSRAVAQGNTEFEENTALAEEAAKRFETAGAQFQLFRNRLRDVAITFGDALVPALLSALDAAEPILGVLRGLAELFAGLDPRIQTAIVALAGLVAAAGPLLAVFGTVVTTLPAIGAALAALTGPVGLVIAAVVGLTVVWVQFGDDITRIVSETFTAVKTWLVDRFTAIVDAVREKVSAITGFFGDLFEAVVGGSYVPDLIDGIEREFARLDEVMVQPALDAVSTVNDAFASVTGPKLRAVTSIDIGAMRPDTGAVEAAAADAADQIGDTISSKLGQVIEAGLSGPVAQLAQSVAAFGPLGLLVPVVTEALEVLEPVILALLEPLEILGRLVGAILTPVLQALEEPLRILATVVTFVVQGLGFFIETLARVVNALIPFGSPLDFLVDIGQNMQDEARAAREALSDAGRDVQEFGSTVRDATKVVRGVVSEWRESLDAFGDVVDAGLGRIRQRADLLDLSPEQQFGDLKAFLESITPGVDFGISSARIGNMDRVIRNFLQLQEQEQNFIGPGGEAISVEGILAVLTEMERLGDSFQGASESVDEFAEAMADFSRTALRNVQTQFDLLDITDPEQQFEQLRRLLSDLVPQGLGGVATATIDNMQVLIESVMRALQRGAEEIGGIPLETIISIVGQMEELGDQTAEAAGNMEQLNSELINAPQGFKIALERFNATIPQEPIFETPIVPELPPLPPLPLPPRPQPPEEEEEPPPEPPPFIPPPFARDPDPRIPRQPEPPIEPAPEPPPRRIDPVVPRQPEIPIGPAPPPPRIDPLPPRLPGFGLGETDRLIDELRADRGDITIQEVHIDAAGKSPAQLWDELEGEIKRRGRARGGTTQLDIAISRSRVRV